MLHRGQLPFHGVVFLRGSRLSFFLGQGGAIARGGDRLNDILCRDDTFVVLRYHGVGHQTDRGTSDALHLADRLLHMGGAGGTGHACDVEFLLHRITSLRCPPPPIWGAPRSTLRRRHKFGAEDFRWRLCCLRDYNARATIQIERSEWETEQALPV